MKPELQNKLFEKYPKIFRQKDLDMKQTLMCWGMECGDGWYNIIDVLCCQVQNHLKHNLKKDQDPAAVNVEAVQVKEKYGGLRFYYNGGDEFIEGLVWMAEAISEQTCEECAAAGTQNSVGWIRTLCDPCRDNYDKIREEKWKTATELLEEAKSKSKSRQHKMSCDTRYGKDCNCMPDQLESPFVPECEKLGENK